jgi:hypothetical protein
MYNLDKEKFSSERLWRRQAATMQALKEKL